MRKFFVLILLAAALAAGCSHNVERVQLPPEAPMDGIERIAVVGFGNYTVDPGIHLLFAQYVARDLRQRYEVVDLAQAEAALASLGVSADQLAVPRVARALGEQLNVDAIITGAATYYFEDTSVSTPECVRCNTPGRTPYWLVHHETTVLATFQARVIRVSDGKILWSNTVDGRDMTSRTIYLDWSGGYDNPPRGSLMPSPDRSDVPATRQEAVREAAGAFTKDLLPRYAWVRRAD